MKKTQYIQISVSENQKLFARRLVEYSLGHHPVANIWDRRKGARPQSRLLRFTGSLGEIVFAEAYHLPPPIRAFGATNGQDWGQDFSIDSGYETFCIDIKSMKRSSGNLAANYVLNIPGHQLHKRGSKTSHYFCISFHQSDTDGTVASFLGFIDKSALENGEVGKLFKAGTIRTRKDGSFFTFNEDTYEILLGDLHPPVLTASVGKMKGFKVCQLKQ